MGCLVGGSSAANTNAGWFDSDVIGVADATAANGAALNSNAGGAVTSGGGANVRITDAFQFGNTVVGSYIRVDFTDDTHADGIYRVNIVDDSYVEIELAYVDDENVTSWSVGGAVPIVDGTCGLQEVLDDNLGSAAANDVDIYVTGSDTATATIVADTGGGASGMLKRIIGTNASYVADGTYATITADSANLAGGPIIQIVDLSYITFENIHVVVSGDAAAAGEDGFQLANTVSKTCVSFFNCKATDAYIGINYSGGSKVASYSHVIDCTSVGSVQYGMDIGSATTITDCYIITAGSRGINVGTAHGVTFDGCIIESGASGIYFNENTGAVCVRNCSFYNQTTACIDASAIREAGLSAFNNLFWVADINADFPILNTAGVIYMLYEDYNFTNADATRSSMLTGANSGNTLWSDTETNLWTDAANHVFSVVDADMIDGGRPTLSDEGGTPADGYSTPGAAQLAQTQADGGVAAGTTNKSGGKQ